MSMTLYGSFFKRMLDILVSVFALVSASPILLVSGIILYVQNNGKIFFHQSRPGLNEKAFTIIKFKTMTDSLDPSGNLLPDNLRLTKVGRFIRKASIDELPQLVNVLKGDMSLVGPRPLLFKYLPLYSPEQRRRHNVKPGITGWAQVNGRNTIPWTRKFQYDVWYVDNLSFLLDLKIIWLTLLKVIKREGVNESAERPMQPFNGSN